MPNCSRLVAFQCPWSASSSFLASSWRALGGRRRWAEGGGAGRTEGSGVSGLRDRAPFAELGDLVLGAFEVHDDDAYRAALRAGIVNRSLVDELRPELLCRMSGHRAPGAVI